MGDAKESFFVRPDGMFIVQRFPDQVLRPQSFLPGSSVLLQKTLNCVQRTFLHSSHTVEKWLQCAGEVAPTTDNVGDYMAQRMVKLHRPCHDFMLLSRHLRSHMGALHHDRKAVQMIELPQFRAGEYKLKLNHGDIHFAPMAGMCLQWSAQRSGEAPRIRLDNDNGEELIARAGRYAAYMIDYNKLTIPQLKNILRQKNEQLSGFVHLLV